MLVTLFGIVMLVRLVQSSNAEACISLVFAFMLVHTITTSKITVSSYGAHLKGVYAMGEKGFGFASACGMLASLINYFPVKLIGVGEGQDDLIDFDASDFTKAFFE